MDRKYAKLRIVGFVADRCSDEHIAIPGCVDSCQLANLLSLGSQANRGGEVVRATLHLLSKDPVQDVPPQRGHSAASRWKNCRAF
jgi:hypothetical protein